MIDIASASLVSRRGAADLLDTIMTSRRIADALTREIARKDR
jgi:hypothetical protein